MKYTWRYRNEVSHYIIYHIHKTNTEWILDGDGNILSNIQDIMFVKKKWIVYIPDYQCWFFYNMTLWESCFSVAKATLHSQMSVRLSVRPSGSKTPQQLKSFIFHHTTFIFHHSSFILHSSLIHLSFTLHSSFILPSFRDF